jgi:hypothetical protein
MEGAVWLRFSVLVLLGCMRLAAGAVIAHWTFDEGIGSTLRDISGNGHDGSIVGAVWDTGVSGTALRFNGAGDHVVVAHHDMFSNLSAITVEAWVWVETHSNEYMAVVGRWGPASHSDDSWKIVGYGLYGHRMAFQTSTGSYFRTALTGAPMEVGQWVYLAGTWDGDSTRMYCDGAQASAVVFRGPLNGNSTPLYMARGNPPYET